MPMTAGERLGPYEIIGTIGAGGMGAVYKARDPRMGREVAIKVSSEEFSERFAREIRAVASLNHPNVCTLHDVGGNYLVMELVEGSTLAERIQQGPMPLEEALSIARQIADALDAAHEKGIVHRDLKPGNVMVKQDGTVKVLDFGLAKVGGIVAPPSDNSPTMNMETQTGVILGTAAYMAPEQAKGKPVDRRADIYAFGVLLYEMLTGKRLHHGETTTEILASVIKEEPQWDQVPARVQRLLRECLEKDPRKRLRHIGDVMLLVEEEQTPGADALPRSRAQSRLLPWSVVALLAIALASIAFVHFREQPPAAQQVRFQIAPPDKTTIPLGGAFAVSPDGRNLAFAAAGEDKVPQLWIRSLDTLEARPLPGGEMSTTPPPMFWSPDSRYVVFQDNEKLKKADIAGGPMQSLCDVTGFVVSGSWNREGQIILGNNVAGKNNGALMRVPSTGGDCAPLTRLDSTRAERYHSFPSFLPDGRHFIYHRFSGPTTSGIYVGTIDAKPEEQSMKQLVATPNGGAYIPPSGSSLGQLLFMKEGTLMAQPFDDRRLELAGDAIPVAEGIGAFLNNAFFSVSTNGVLIYRAGREQGFNQLTFVDQKGNRTGAVGEPGTYNNLAVSPDGTRAAVSRPDSDIWLIDLVRNVSTRFTFGRGRSQNPVWSPDGTRIVFASDRDGGVFNLYEKPASGAKEEELLLKSADAKIPTNWSADGRFLLYMTLDKKTAADIWVLPLDANGAVAGEPKPFARSEFSERFASFSPDSRWIAYNSNESGRDEIYVRPFQPSSGGAASDGGKWMISRGTATGATWTNGGKQLVYSSSDFRVTAVDVAAGSTFQPGSPRVLFALTGVPIAGIAYLPDGRILSALPAAPAAPSPFTVVLNWPASLHK